ncbi:MAG: hypothetical protein JWQ24_2115 [Tardiphaga sp.]|nr:hypothetical protein [Tardiphaga sp.]
MDETELVMIDYTNFRGERGGCSAPSKLRRARRVIFP